MHAIKVLLTLVALDNQCNFLVLVARVDVSGIRASAVSRVFHVGKWKNELEDAKSLWNTRIIPRGIATSGGGRHAETNPAMEIWCVYREYNDRVVFGDATDYLVARRR
jgi:hypothetical protein